jgi:hypothetical protein
MRAAKEASCSRYFSGCDPSLPVGTSLITRMMGDHRRTHPTVNPISEQIDEFRAEIERLKAEGTTDSRSGACDVGMAATTGRNDTASGAGRRIDLLSGYVESR